MEYKHKPESSQTSVC